MCYNEEIAEAVMYESYDYADSYTPMDEIPSEYSPDPEDWTFGDLPF